MKIRKLVLKRPYTRYLKILWSLIAGQYKIIKYSRLSFQKKNWEEALARYDWDAEQLYGYEWGDPESSSNELGNYLAIKNRLVSLVNNKTTVLEIGSLGGKWTQYVHHAHRVICVDINKTSFEYIKKKIPQDNFEFYLTKGDELYGIPDESVDLVFSIDSFVHISKKLIFRYFKEISRVLKYGGKILLHLPCVNMPTSFWKWFTPLTLGEIERNCKKNNFKEINIDKQVIKHGIILEAVKG